MSAKLEQVIRLLRTSADMPDAGLTDHGHGMKELAKILLEILDA
jgi:hypothetical protein